MVMRAVLPYAPSGGLVLIDFKLILITLVGIVCIGLLSGIYPAWRAGRIRPLEAIRGEAAR
jgi:ABC-type lipoprotein release transport system permease subunit